MLKSVHVCLGLFLEGRGERETDEDSLDDSGSLSLGDDCSGSLNGEEADSYIETIHQQRRGKKRVLSESPIKAPDHLEITCCTLYAYVCKASSSTELRVYAYVLVGGGRGAALIRAHPKFSKGYLNF